MSQSSPSPEAPSMTCLNPHAHHISVTSSQSWTWVTLSTPSRSLPPEVRKRLLCLRWHQTHDQNVSRTCRHFGISRPTFYAWRDHYQQQSAGGLGDRSHRPHRCARPTWSVEQSQAVLALREQHHGWGKRKLQILLARDGIDLSVSMVGRILAQLTRRGDLREARPKRTTRGRSATRPHAMRKPKDYAIMLPGDLVQVDTLDVRPIPGRIFKHLSLIDVTSRYGAAEIRVGATAATTTESLERHPEGTRDRLPFAVKAIQIDGGSEFKADFEVYCQTHALKLFLLPPRSPKLNGRVERLQRTFREEFYASCTAPPHVADLATELAAYETVYNTIRPHQALDYLTPHEYLDQHQEAA